MFRRVRPQRRATLSSGKLVGCGCWAGRFMGGMVHAFGGEVMLAREGEFYPRIIPNDPVTAGWFDSVA
jgi:hypothetical protein